MATPDENELLARKLADGDPEALEELLARNLPSLRAFVRGRLGSELRRFESESDLVQSTCRELLAHADRFQHPGPDAFRHWLFTTAARKVSDRLRRHRAAKREGELARDERSVGDLAASRLLEAYGRFSSPSHRVTVEDEVARIEGALDRLSEEAREVVLLAKVAELPRAEIAARLGRSEVAVRSILHRALARLATELDRGA